MLPRVTFIKHQFNHIGFISITSTDTNKQIITFIYQAIDIYLIYSNVSMCCKRYDERYGGGYKNGSLFFLKANLQMTSDRIFFYQESTLKRINIFIFKKSFILFFVCYFKHFCRFFCFFVLFFMHYIIHNTHTITNNVILYTLVVLI